MRVDHRVHIPAGVINRRVNHRFPRRILELGDGPGAARLGVVLFAIFHIFIDIHQDDMFRSDFAEGREHRFDGGDDRPVDYAEEAGE